MKQCLLIAAICTIATTIFCQEKPYSIDNQGNNRIEIVDYENGLNRLKLTISAANDTLFMEEFQRNGLVAWRQWRQDSMHQFDNRGNLRSRYLGIKEIYNHYDRRTVYSDSVVHYHANGRQSIFFDEKGEWTSDKITSPDGKLVHEKLFLKRRGISYETEKDAQGLSYYGFKTDTFFIGKDTILEKTDTFFHTNGQVRMVIVAKQQGEGWTAKTDILRHDYFDTNGQLVESVAPPDSLRHQLFKDNISCLYGFKNQRGDTLIAPKYEQVVTLDQDIFAVYEGLNCFLMRNDGRILPTPPLSDVGKMSQLDLAKTLNIKRLYPSEFSMRSHQRFRAPYHLQSYFYIKTEGKTGVVDRRGAVVIPPQYLPQNHLKSIRDEDSYYMSGMDYVGNADFLAFSESKMSEKTKYWTPQRTGFINKKGQDVFGEKYKDVKHSDYENYFEVSEKIQQFNNLDTPYWGLADGTTGELILDCRFQEIKNVLHTPFFITTIKTQDKTGKEILKKGLFDVSTKRWILDTAQRTLSVFQRVDTVYQDFEYRFEAEKPRFFIFQDAKTQKYGLLNGNAQILIPPQYDTLGVADAEKNLFWYRKNTRYNILKLNEKGIKRLDYDYLMPINFPIINNGNYSIFGNYSNQKDWHFVAKRGGKWGIIHADNEAIIVDFIYDYAAIPSSNFYNAYQAEIFLFKNEQADRFDAHSLPKPNTFKRFEGHQTTIPELNCLLVDNFAKRVFMDTTGKVIIPPQYRVLEISTEGYGMTNFALVEDADNKRKIVLLDNARIIDFPFDYRFVAMHPNGQLMIVQNAKQIRKTEGSRFLTITPKGKYGVVSTDGKLLMPCENFIVALSDVESKVFFAKKDTLTEAFDYRKRVCSDTLNVFDNDWLMYDREGKLLNAKPFRFPIIFKNGLGVGMQGDEFSIFRSDGTIMRPISANGENTPISQNYPNIWYDVHTDLYLLYERRGLTSTLKMVDKNGKTRLEAGRYDGISPFFGKYAFVSLAGKIGLVDTSGKEIIAPQDLRQYNGSLIDVLDAANLHNKEGYQSLTRNPKYPLLLPIFFNEAYGFNAKKVHPDSLNISKSLRNSLWNLLLESHSPQMIRHIGDQLIDRPELHTGINDPYNYGRSACFSNNLVVQKVIVSDNFIAFVTNAGPRDYTEMVPTTFHNFHRKNNRWERLDAFNFFKNDADTKTKFYEKLVQKIRALKDTDIDCSNSATLIEQAQNNYMLTSEGITIYFKSSYQKRAFLKLDKQGITFSWAELTPFLITPMKN